MIPPIGREGKPRVRAWHKRSPPFATGQGLGRDGRTPSAAFTQARLICLRVAYPNSHTAGQTASYEQYALVAFPESPRGSAPHCRVSTKPFGRAGETILKPAPTINFSVSVAWVRRMIELGAVVLVCLVPASFWLMAVGAYLGDQAAGKNHGKWGSAPLTQVMLFPRSTP
jgi:hypothetical protein